MSYCRWAEDGSDLYVYPTGYYDKDLRKNVVQIVCMECLLQEPDKDGWRGDFVAASPVHMYCHLKVHIAAGHTVAPRAIERLKREIAEVEDAADT